MTDQRSPVVARRSKTKSQYGSSASSADATTHAIRPLAHKNQGVSTGTPNAPGSSGIVAKPLSLQAIATPTARVVSISPRRMVDKASHAARLSPAVFHRRVRLLRGAPSIATSITATVGRFSSALAQNGSSDCAVEDTLIAMAMVGGKPSTVDGRWLTREAISCGPSPSCAILFVTTTVHPTACQRVGAGSVVTATSRLGDE
jgi:hypothetical protein